MTYHQKLIHVIRLFVLTFNEVHINFSSGFCASKPCYNGGRCFEDSRGFICSCVGGYTGTQCNGIYSIKYDFICYILDFVNMLFLIASESGTPVSRSTNKSDRHDINVILLKVTLNTLRRNVI